MPQYRFFRTLGGLVLAASLHAAPLISPGGIVNSASFAPPLSPGGAIAQGSIFSIFGSQLGPSTGVQPTTFPLGTALGGVSIKVVQGAVSVNALPLYVSSGLINAVMPSNAPTGKVSVQVTYSGAASNLAPVQVVANAPGIYTATGAGLGPGILQNAVSATLVPLNSASTTATPGQTEILWLTGLGPISAPDNAAPPVGNLPFPVEVWVGGQLMTNVAYSGRTPCCSGVDEIVFTLPSNVPTGCFVPVTVRVAGKAVSNTVTMAIDAQGKNCSDAANPFSGTLTQGGKTGVIALMRQARHSDTGSITDLTTDTGAAAFVTSNGAGFVFNSAVAVPPAGSCTVYTGAGDYTSGATQFAFPNTILDAGALTISGSANQQFTKTTANGETVYLTRNGSSAGGTPLFLGPGQFTVAGSGGADVGAFNVSLTVPSSGVTWTNRDQISTIDRTQPLTFSWSGQAPAVAISGVSFDAPANASTAFRCIAPAGATSFTVPTWVLANLLSSEPVVSNSSALAALTALSAPVSFSASGLDTGAALFVSSQQKVVTVK